jgi:hypothetical protein
MAEPAETDATTQPRELSRMRQRLDDWRKSNGRGTAFPEKFWVSAGRLAGKQGDYTSTPAARKSMRIRHLKKYFPKKTSTFILPELHDNQVAADILSVGDKMVLLWITRGTTSCSGTRAWTDAVAPGKGSRVAKSTNAGNYDFILNCQDPNDSSSATLPVLVQP